MIEMDDRHIPPRKEAEVLTQEQLNTLLAEGAHMAEFIRPIPPANPDQKGFLLGDERL